ncbi:TetR/AcrR family transcriptional regulator, partial [Pseudomonas syringae pv. tagetis]|uniref:TetR/AcrR family transcriptional regulator n=1 Tax=Pseudomonas syringae group genomosp. 7 TaxID=251699 RepID=UPI00376F8003
CALTLFNQQGERNASTLEIANEMGFSRGYLFYHFLGKEPLFLSLFELFHTELAALLDPASDARVEADDYWMFLDLFVERLSQYRFVFQDLSHLAVWLPKMARGIR